jgi:hypothetical protein
MRDHSPKCQLYVQILKPENRLHLEVADHIVCEGELKYALVANSCHCPGITTLVRSCPPIYSNQICLSILDKVLCSEKFGRGDLGELLMHKCT